MATGGAGMLIPPNTLYKDVCNFDLFLKLCPSGDDLWIWAMAMLNNTKICLVQDNMKELIYTNPLREYGIIKGHTLYKSNSLGGNDRQLNAIIQYYPQLMDIIKNLRVKI